MRYEKYIQNTEIRLSLRQQKSGRRRLHEAPARRQRRQPGGNDPHRPARSARLHHHHRRSAPTITPTKRPIPRNSWPQVKAGVANTEKILGKKFGDLEKPLLVSVRSGARDSMPGMMDTILNLGLNDQTVARPGKSQQQPPLCLGLLPPLHPNVRRRRHGRAKETRRRPRAF